MRIDLTSDNSNIDVKEEFLRTIKNGEVTIAMEISVGVVDFRLSSIEDVVSPGAANMKEMAERIGIPDVVNYIELGNMEYELGDYEGELEENHSDNYLEVLGLEYDALGFHLCLEGDGDVVDKLHELFIDKVLEYAAQ